MDVQRDVLETEVWEVHYHVVVLDLARKAVFLLGDQTRAPDAPGFRN